MIRFAAFQTLRVLLQKRMRWIMHNECEYFRSWIICSFSNDSIAWSWVYSSFCVIRKYACGGNEKNMLPCTACWLHDPTFPYFRALKSVDRWILRSSETPVHAFRSCKSVKYFWSGGWLRKQKLWEPFTVVRSIDNIAISAILLSLVNVEAGGITTIFLAW